MDSSHMPMYSVTHPVPKTRSFSGNFSFAPRIENDNRRKKQPSTTIISWTTSDVKPSSTSSA
ncbi:unnamed protein product [Coffea canephora]|uniref:Uncharacterized protein n=1 Tax=Coffea canephora TaxID=49390 RepID=A0A068TTL7_COFCA|nr:unnamed protein product [Coffea canephora]